MHSLHIQLSVKIRNFHYITYIIDEIMLLLVMAT